MPRTVFVAVTVARGRTVSISRKRLRQQKNCETHSFQGMLHQAIIRAICVATKIRDKLQEKLSSVTAPLEGFHLSPWCSIKAPIPLLHVNNECK